MARFLHPSPHMNIQTFRKKFTVDSGEKKGNVHTRCRFLHPHTDILAKIVISILLIGVGFRVLSPRLNLSPPSVAEKDQPFLEEEKVAIAVTFDPPANPVQIHNVQDENKCDLFNGDWIPNIAGPAYTNETCSLIENHQNCMKNGRPDTGYLYWKWKPRECNLPTFNGRRFLMMMRNKSWALIGDSITRNHVQSLLCILSKVEQAVEVYHDAEYKSKRWYFPNHNFTVSVIWSPFLVKAAIFENNDGVSTSEIKLQLDKLDETWTKQFHQWDYTIFSSGKWFIKTAIYYENNTVSGCHYCANKKIKTLGYNFAYRQVLKRVFKFILESNYKGMIFYRTTTPDHFEDGQWFSGGTCRRTGPAKEGEYELNELIQILRDVELEEFAKVEARALEKGVNLKLLDLIELTLTRPDGHPGPYRHFQPFAKDKHAKVGSDCLHWCLPGPIDSWNDMIMEMVLNR